MSNPLAKLVSLLKPKRRWAQFSLATLLVVVTVLCVWLAVQVNRAHRQRDAVAAVKAWGGWVEYDYEQPNTHSSFWRKRLRPLLSEEYVDRVVGVGLPPDKGTFSKKFKGTRFSPGLPYTESPPITDGGLRKVALFTELGHLALSYTNIGDAGLAHLHDLKSLRILELGYTDLTDAGLVNLSGLRQLEHLSLDATQIGDSGVTNLRSLRNLRKLTLNFTRLSGAGLEHVRDLKNLECLELAGTRVDDDGLASLAHLAKLETLLLMDTNVTDAGLVHLEGLASLQKLGIDGTKITDSGVAELQKALPNCEIIR